MRKFTENFGTPMAAVYGEVMDKLCAQGLLVQEEGHIRLTARGIDISNYVMAQFLFDETG
ncbi:MAG: coproporphyrinogen III oxidase, partial [Lachnospiraceae bacterium]|nr:coproporphyrinogen III oxidase [Lachnospiraceae bacterium]